MLVQNVKLSGGSQEGQKDQRFRGSAEARISSQILIDFRQDVSKDKLDTDSLFPLKIKLLRRVLQVTNFYLHLCLPKQVSQDSTSPKTCQIPRLLFITEFLLQVVPFVLK